MGKEETVLAQFKNWLGHKESSLHPIKCLEQSRYEDIQNKPVATAATVESDKDSSMTTIRLTAHHDLFDICSTVGQVNSFFDTELFQYRHRHRRYHPHQPDQSVVTAEMGEYPMGVRAAKELKVPEHLHEHIDFMGGLNTPMHRYDLSSKNIATHTQMREGTGKPTNEISSQIKMLIHLAFCLCSCFPPC